MTIARIGWGSKVLISTDETEANLVELGEVKGFSLPDDEVEEIDATHLQSPGRRREFVPGMIDGGEVEVTMNFDPGSASDLLIEAAKAAGDTRYVRFVISSPDGTADSHYDTTGFVKGYARGPFAPDAISEATLRLRITGEVTYGAGEG
jgi:hypothetical protein